MQKPSRNTHTERFTLRISRDLLDRVCRKAQESGLSASAYIRMVLSRETKQEPEE